MRLSPTAAVAGHASGRFPWTSGAAFRRLRLGWNARRRNHRDAAQLAQLSDRELWDVGLSRCDVASVARGNYRRD
jgi:uncharacterized protein YjiS (DUF1127 family)